VRLVDTAGLGDAQDRIDALGQAMSHRYLEAADLVVLCREEGRAGTAAQTEATFAPGRILEVHTKSDVTSTGKECRGLPVSAVTGAGLDNLRQAVAERLFKDGAVLADLEPALTRERHRVALVEAERSLGDAAPHLVAGGDAVLAAHHVQEAVRALDSLLGAVDIEEVLDRVFASFCVGK
jgi:tRNA modification GTPase